MSTSTILAFAQDPLSPKPYPPFEILPARASLKRGDIHRATDRSIAWEYISPKEVGQTATEEFIYARVAVPDGYRISKLSETTEVGDMVWAEHLAEGWSDIVSVGLRLGSKVADVCDEMIACQSSRTFIAKPESSASASKSIPAYHRLMSPGESLRRGDRCIVGAMNSWRRIDDSDRGSVIKGPDELYDQFMFCRPTSPSHRYWYIDEKHGSDKSLGGKDDPWRTLEHAKSFIAKSSAKTGHKVFGSILNANDVAVHHIDVAEPEPDPDQAAIQRANAAVVEKMESERSKAEIDIVLGEQVEGCRPKHWNRELVKKSKRRMPEGFRIMFQGEELNTPDLVYMEVSQGHWSWSRPTSDLLGLKVETVDEVCAREEHAIGTLAMLPEELSKIKELLTFAAARIALVEERYFAE